MTTHQIHANGTCPHSWCRAHGTEAAPTDDAVRTATTAVQLARARLLHVRRAHGRRQAGAADLVAAEARLGAALDQLDAVLGVGWRA